MRQIRKQLASAALVAAVLVPAASDVQAWCFWGGGSRGKFPGYGSGASGWGRGMNPLNSMNPWGRTQDPWGSMDPWGDGMNPWDNTTSQWNGRYDRWSGSYGARGAGMDSWDDIDSWGF
jgi:hypothetical protein